MQIMLMHILQNVKPFPYLYILSILSILSIVLNSTGIQTNEKEREKERGEEKCDYYCISMCERAGELVKSYQAYLFDVV